MRSEMTEPGETINEYMDRLRLTSEVELIGTDDAAWTYKVRFRYGARELVLDYEDFDEHSAAIVAREALDEAASDATCVENSTNLWEWCEEYYGLEPHNPIIPDPEETYLIQRRRAKDLREFLGADEYETLLYRVERIYAAE